MKIGWLHIHLYACCHSGVSILYSLTYVWMLFANTATIQVYTSIATKIAAHLLPGRGVAKAIDARTEVM